jgi:hypothetical protein
LYVSKKRKGLIEETLCDQTFINPTFLALVIQLGQGGQAIFQSPFRVPGTITKTGFAKPILFDHLRSPVSTQVYPQSKKSNAPKTTHGKNQDSFTCRASGLRTIICSFFLISCKVNTRSTWKRFCAFSRLE